MESAPAPPGFEVRPPWPDEIARVKLYLPAAFLYDDHPRLGVAVAGRAGQLVGASAVSMLPLRAERTVGLCLRVNESPARLAITEALIGPALEAAWAAGARSVGFGQTVEAQSPGAALLRRLGFQPHETHEVYEVQCAPLWARLDRVYRRLRSRDLIPRGVEVTHLLTAMGSEARRFLAAHMPQSLSALALGAGGYEAGSSHALWLDGEMKGLLLGRRLGKTTHLTGLRVIAPELRGGLAWANLMLLHAATKLGVEAGLEWSRFELNPQWHRDTRQLALSLGARLVTHLELFRLERRKID